jgi:hypothetical protein
MEAALVQVCTLTRATLFSSRRHQNLASFNDRIAEFIADRFPDDGSPVELLCVDHNGTYVIPFPCHRVEDAWRNFETHESIEAEVAGWRLRGRRRRWANGAILSRRGQLAPAGGRCTKEPADFLFDVGGSFCSAKELWKPLPNAFARLIEIA